MAVEKVVDHDIDISCDGPDPEDTDASSGDQVTFINSTGASVTISFSASGVFNPSPGSTITIAKDGSRTLTIGTIGSGTDFEYPDCGEALGTRSGRIDPA